jgi:hypothetical protein
MDAAKVWTPLILLAILIGGIFLYRHLDLVDRANEAYITTRDTLHTAEESLRVRQTQWDGVSKAVGEARTKLAAATEKHAKAATTNAEADKLQQKVESELNYLINSFAGSVEKVRSDALGTRLPSLVLADGKTLTNAQFKKIDDSGISFIHDGGFGTVPLSNLPNHIVEQFDIGPSSIINKARELKAEAARTPTADKTEVQPPPTAVTAMPEPAHASTPPKASSSEDLEKLKKIQIKMATVEAQIKAVAANKENWETAATRAAEMALEANYRGTPTSRHRADEANARLQINLCVQQTAQLEGELGRLRVEESALKRTVN